MVAGQAGDVFMLVAFLSDVHANFTALVAALSRARRAGAERIVVAGDVVGGGPHPVEVIRLLSAEGVEGVRGNVDRKVVQLARRRKLARSLLDDRRKGHLAWTALQLGEKELEWLRALPASQTLEIGGVAIEVVHGSPRSDLDYIFPSVTAVALRAMLGECSPKLLVCGHSHIPFARSLGALRIVNCGSVGRPVDGDPRGSFALVELGGGRVGRTSIVRFAYSLQRLLEDLRVRAVPGAIAEEYVAGIKRKGV